MPPIEKVQTFAQRRTGQQVNARRLKTIVIHPLTENGTAIYETGTETAGTFTAAAGEPDVHETLDDTDVQAILSAIDTVHTRVGPRVATR